MHGYGIAVRLEQMSKGVFRLNAGSLFVAFQRLQRDGLINNEWKATKNSRRAKYYALTDQGRKRLNSETREWGRQVAAIARILEATKRRNHAHAPKYRERTPIAVPKGAGHQDAGIRHKRLTGECS